MSDAQLAREAHGPRLPSVVGFAGRGPSGVTPSHFRRERWHVAVTQERRGVAMRGPADLMRRAYSWIACPPNALARRSRQPLKSS